MSKNMKNTPLRNRDMMVIKIVDFTDDPSDGEPAYDVEVYINGKFVFEKSDVFPIIKGFHKGDKKELALLKAKYFAMNALNENLQ